MKAPAPDAIGAYRIRGRLGSGGMGEVFLAFDERLGRHVAIKRLRPEVETTSNRRRLRREARAAAILNHPGIVQIHDILEDDSGDSIVMEYVEGRTLDRVLAEEGVTAALAVDLARQVAEGLAAAHDRGIVHRDLKAENVVVTPDGRAKILDFGLAKPPPFTQGDALTQEGAVLGTLRTMSPEQAAGRPADARSDLYSLGVLLYETLTGRPPFEGSGIASLHQQVLSARPVPLVHLRPELPSELSSLVESLLEKDPDRRPQTARQIVARLGALEESSALAALGARSRSAVRATSSEAASDAPTRVSPSHGTSAIPSGRPEPLASEASGRSSEESAGRGPRWRALFAILAAGLAAVAAYFLVHQPVPIRVVVAPPEVEGGEENPVLAALVVREAALGTLLALEGLELPDPTEVGEEPRTVSEIARATAADEVVAAKIDLRDKILWITLRRVDGRDSRVIWSSGAFEVPNRPEVSRQLADAVGSRLRKAYPNHRLRRGFPELDVRESDYTAFLELQKSTLAGKDLGETELEQLEALLESSPRFLPAYLLAADVARTLHQNDRSRGHLDRASELAQGDPRQFFQRAVLELGAGRFREAEEAILELERRAPGDLQVDHLRARLLERRGRLREALGKWRKIVDVRPSWRYLYHLGRVESRLGEIEEARGHFERMLEVSPRNPQGLSELARLELVYGDLEAAERLYRELLEIRRVRSDFTNLGTVLFLRGRYRASAQAFRQALEIAPSHVLVRLNLADAELAAGSAEEARDLYRGIADELGAHEGARGTDAKLSMVLAQCLARLGDARLAVEITQRTLARHSENADVNFQAALVYALAGERNSALASAEEALKLGVQRRWFEIPEFDAVRSELGRPHDRSSSAR